MSGGVAAELSGGKFANGAVTAAFFHLFNQEAERFVANSAKRNSGFIGTLKMIWRDSIISESFKDGTRDWGNMTYDMFTPGSPLADHGAYDPNADWVNWSRGANVVAATTMAAAGGSSLFYGGGGTALWTGGLGAAEGTSAASRLGLTTYGQTIGGRVLLGVFRSFDARVPTALPKWTSGIFAANAHGTVTVFTQGMDPGKIFVFERAVIQFLRNASIRGRFVFP